MDTQLSYWINNFCILILGLILTPISFAMQKGALLPLPSAPAENQALESLGKKLFYESALSSEGTLSCASCHQLHLAGTDNKEKFVGYNNIRGNVNTSSVYNSHYNFKYFWNGRANSIYEVIDEHIENKKIFNNDWKTIIEKLNTQPGYKQGFENAFANGINENNIVSTINAFLQTLVSSNAPFDQYLNGDKNAISEEAQKGYELFKEHGCVTCHQGKNIGGNLYQKMGIYEDYFTKKKFISQSDLGLFNFTGAEEDKYVFKVPSLRNVAVTAPYLHDGSAKTLEEVIGIMAEYQVGHNIPNREVSLIVKFLETLTGDLPNKE